MTGTTLLLLLSVAATVVFAVVLVSGVDVDTPLGPLAALLAALTLTGWVAVGLSSFVGIPLALVIAGVVGVGVSVGMWRGLVKLSEGGSDESTSLAASAAGNIGVVLVDIQPGSVGRISTTVNGLPLVLSATSDDVCPQGSSVLIETATSGTCVHVRPYLT